MTGSSMERLSVGTKKLDVESKLMEIIRRNPYIAEPWLMLGQEYFHRREFARAYFCSVKGILKLLQLGTAWDKRYSF